jgi:hypothetical protein
MTSGDAADDVRFLHVSSDDTSRFIDEMVPLFSIKYRLTDDCIAFKLSGSYSSFFFDLTDKKNLASY